MTRKKNKKKSPEQTSTLLSMPIILVNGGEYFIGWV